MRRLTMLAWVCAGTLCGVSACRADTIFLLNGDEVIGKILEESDFAITLKEEVTGKLRSIRRASIDVIVYDPKSAIEEKVAAAETKQPVKTDTGSGTSEKKAEGKETTEKAGDKQKESKEGKEAKGTQGTKGTKGTKGAKEVKKGEAGEEKKKGEAGEVKKEGEEGKAEETEKKEEEEPEEEAPKMNEEQQKAFDAAMQKMESKDPVERGAAKQDLKKIGPLAMPDIAKALNHINPDVRAAIATLLGEMHAANAIKNLIEVFYSAMPEEGQCASYQRVFIRGLKDALASVTGKAFINVEADKPMVQDGLKKYIEWYNENFDRLPPQIGEPKIEATDPDYMKKVAEFRKLKLEKKTWPRPSMFEGLGNVTKIPEPKAIIRPADEAYKLEAMPKVDRKSAGGYFRDSDQKYSEDFYKKKEDKGK